ncbi:sensor histidine kinase, partial [Clostridium tarantellae]
IVIYNNRSLMIFLKLTILIYLIAMGVCFIKVIKSLEFIYIPIMICIGLFSIKLLFALGLLIDRSLILLLNSILISVLMFLSFIFGLLIDSIIKIKKQKRLERQLKIFYHLAEKNNHIEMIILNEENKVIYANKKSRKKRSKNNNVRQAYEDICNFIRDNIIEDLKELFNNEVNTMDKCIKVNNDKEVLKCNVQTLDLGQNCKYKSLIFTDITSTYNRNEKIKISEQRLRGVTENISEIIISVDSQGVVTYVNNSCLNIFSCKENDLIGKKINDFLIEEDGPLHINDINRNVNNELIRAKMISKHNNIKMLEITRNQIINSEGEIIGKVLIGKDLDYINEIEKLRTKYKEIQEYDRIKNEFFANLSHELRTPINIIYSCLQLLTTFSDKDNEEFKKYYIKYSKTLKQNCFRMMRIVNNLIDITKIESGFMKMDFQNYDIVSLVENITLSVIPYVESKKLNITFDTDVEELEIKCDPDKIERVILNLLSNAIKFSNIGGNILVDISEKNRKVFIRVKDDGIGIPSNMKDVVFKRFIQTDKSFRRAKEGSGIGLALVKSLVELHNGKIYLEKNTDKGSEFVIVLPSEKIESDVEEDKINYYESQVESISIEFADIYDIN